MEIFFRILSSTREQTDVILASFSENVVVAGTRQLSNVRNFITYRSGGGFTFFNGNKRTNFCGEKKTKQNKTMKPRE